MELRSVARHWLAAGCCSGGLWAWAPDAAACTYPDLPSFSIDPAQRALDSEPPSTPLHVEGVASRSSGAYCSGDECTVSCAPSSGSLHLTFEPARDNRSTLLGYRLQLLSGSLPPELQAPLRRIANGTSELRIGLPFEEVVDLDATFALIAIDAAGNESAPSQPFHVAFDGCTQIVSRTGCAEEMAGVTCDRSMCSGPSDDESNGCSLAAPGSARAQPALLALGLCLGAGALAARRRRS